MRRWQSYNRGYVVLMLSKLNKMVEFALLDVAVVDDDWRRASLHLLTELCVVLLLNLN